MGSREHGQPYFLQVGSVIAAPGLWSTVSVAVVHRFSCSLARGIFLNQRLKLCGFFTTEPPGKTNEWYFLDCGEIDTIFYHFKCTIQWH